MANMIYDFVVELSCNLTNAQMEKMNLLWIQGNPYFHNDYGDARGVTHILAIGPNIPSSAIYDSTPESGVIGEYIYNEGVIEMAYILYYADGQVSHIYDPVIVNVSNIQDGETVTIEVPVEYLECTPGDTRCIGGDLQECRSDGWCWVDYCSPECGCMGGCTDPSADNYDPSANTDDGSCVYSGDIPPTPPTPGPIPGPNKNWIVPVTLSIAGIAGIVYAYIKRK